VIRSLFRIKCILTICLLLSVSLLNEKLYGYCNQIELEGNEKHELVVKPLNLIPITSNTGEKPQSKLWFYANNWWAVLPNLNGTNLWRLENEKWSNVLHLSDSTKTFADVRNIDSVTHILLYQGEKSELVSIEYNSVLMDYQVWSKRQFSVNIQLEHASETATLDIDTFGRMWLVSDNETEINVRWSDSPYNLWSNPIALATNILADDICALCTFPNGNVGVMWSNQNTKRFGFRMHQYGTKPELWLDDEIPASGSAIELNGGMADDHLNLAVATDGTLYAVVKTSYDSVGYPLIALLVRQPSGIWDKLNVVDDEGSRGIVLLSKNEENVIVVYTSYRDNKIVSKISKTKPICFGKRQTLIEGWKNVNNVTSTKQNFKNEVVVLASELGFARAVQLTWISKE